MTKKHKANSKKWRMRTTNVFKENLIAYNKYKGSQTVITNQGGQGSSKTRSILQLIYHISRTSKSKKRITIGSYALPHLKGGAMQDFDDILMEENIYPDNVRNKTEQKYFIGNGEISFIGIEGNEAKATGPRRDILFINEANKRIAYNVFELMNARTALATFIDYNPSREFWFHDKIMPNFPYRLIKSTYLDNPYLPDRELDNILSKRDKPGFENWWKVYGLGELGQLEDAILTNWKFGEFDNSLPYGYGLDFGVKDPDALVKVAVDRKNKIIYLKEELYKTGNSTAELAQSIKSKDVGSSLIIAESASPRTIIDLRSQGLNVRAVQKGRILDDVKMLMDWQIVVDPDSYNLEKELNGWIWLDKKGEVPLDDFNHLIDASRYYTRMIIKPRTSKGHRIL